METIATKSVRDGSQGKETTDLEKTKSNAVKGLRSLFLAELREIYWAENAIKKPLHKMLKHTSSDDLTNELTKYLESIKMHRDRLEEVFRMIDEKTEVVKSKAVEGLIKEVDKTMEETKKGILKDAGIISAALKIKHYGIASYGLLCFYARTLGEDNAASLLHETLIQEKEANEMLSQIIETIKLQIV